MKIGDVKHEIPIAGSMQLAVLFRPIAEKAKNSKIPVYLPSQLEVKDVQNRPVSFFVLDNSHFPLVFGLDSYTIWLGTNLDCQSMACISGVIYAEKGSLPTQGEALQLSGNIRAAYYRGRDKLADWVVFSKDGVNYGFSFGIPEQGKDVYIRIAESALRLGPLPGKQSASPQKTNAYASDFGYTPQRSSAAPIANLAELAFCYVKQYAPQDIKEEGNVKCTGKAELFKQEVVANMRTSADGIACMDNPNLDKIIVAIAEVLWTNQQNSWYTPGSAIPISINIVCEKVKAKAR